MYIYCIETCTVVRGTHMHTHMLMILLGPAGIRELGPLLLPPPGLHPWTNQAATGEANLFIYLFISCTDSQAPFYLFSPDVADE